MATAWSRRLLWVVHLPEFIPYRSAWTRDDPASLFDEGFA
jgi:hypothetical protein